MPWICCEAERSFLLPRSGNNRCWYEAYLVSFGARQRLAARDSSPGGCRSPVPAPRFGRKACGDYAYRQTPQPDARASLQFLGDMPWVSRATAIWPDIRYVARDSDDVNTCYTPRSVRWPVSPQLIALNQGRTSGRRGTWGVDDSKNHQGVCMDHLRLRQCTGKLWRGTSPRRTTPVRKSVVRFQNPRMKSR